MTDPRDEAPLTEPDESRVRAVAADEVPDIIAVLCDAFRDYPVMRSVLGAPRPDDSARLERLIHGDRLARAMRAEAMFGIRCEGGARRRGDDIEPGWAELGAEARARHERCGTVWRRLAPREDRGIELGRHGTSATSRARPFSF